MIKTVQRENKEQYLLMMYLSFLDSISEESFACDRGDEWETMDYMWMEHVNQNGIFWECLETSEEAQKVYNKANNIED